MAVQKSHSVPVLENRDMRRSHHRMEIAEAKYRCNDW